MVQSCARAVMAAQYRVVTSCPQTALEGGTLTSSAGTSVPLLVRLAVVSFGMRGGRGTRWGVGSGRRHAVGS